MQTNRSTDMCGRYALFKKLDEIDHFLGELDREAESEPNYNVAPTHRMPVVVRDEGGLHLRQQHWGFMAWKPKEGRRPFIPVNTRKESLSEKPMWRSAFRERRCVVPMNGFYEWSGPKGKKTPHFISGTQDDLLFAAGLYSELSPHEGMGSFSIITTPPNQLMNPIHDRMPAFLHPEEVSLWLEPGQQVSLLKDLLQPYPDDALREYIVSKAVGNVRNNEPGLVEPSTLF